MITCRCGITPKGNICLCGNKLYEVKEKTKKPLKKISDKQKVILAGKKAQLKYFKKHRKGVCSGCGKSWLLSNSHLIPISYNKSLELVEENQVWHCVDECHVLWENSKQERKKMKDYSENMEKIKRLDITYYNLIVGKNGL